MSDLGSSASSERPSCKDALKTEDVCILVSGGVVYAWVGPKP
jgi:hypothetical protein